jgi:hypothetical protein
MDDQGAIPHPEKDLQHAYDMLAHMNPHELLCATYAMEDILEGAVYVTHDMPVEDEEISAEEVDSAVRGRADLAAGRVRTLEELGQELDLPLKLIQGLPTAECGSGER